MTNEQFLKHAEKYYDTASFQHAKKLVAVADAASASLPFFDHESGYASAEEQQLKTALIGARIMFGYEDELKEQMVELHSEVERLRKENKKLMKVVSAAMALKGDLDAHDESPLHFVSYTTLTEALEELWS